jgi:glycosyltransferase involved in cell wall biosynthesis
LLVGKNKLPESYYREHVEQNQDVHHIEHVPNEEISQLYNLSDVFVLPSVTIENNEEQFGMALIEAMACGTPSVVTDVGGLPHVAEEGHTSLVVPERSDKALAEAITELYHNNEKAETMGTNAYQYAREHYTPAVVGEQLYDFYTQI